ncbi:MAG: YkvA family protein [Actinomycetia bacterium]|nr:YkvA family protein [Actinomycetes bacterium]
MASARSRVLVLTTLYRAVRIAMRPGGPSLGSRLAALPRLISQTVSGRYAGLTAGRLALMAGALAYIVSPIDLIPEGMLMFAGLLDDAMVMSWLAAALVTETESFLAWEGEGRSVPEGAAALVIPGEVTATS